MATAFPLRFPFLLTTTLLTLLTTPNNAAALYNKNSYLPKLDFVSIVDGRCITVVARQEESYRDAILRANSKLSFREEWVPSMDMHAQQQSVASATAVWAPPSPMEERYIQRLRQDLHHLPSISDEDNEDNHWKCLQGLVTRLIREFDPRYFRRWTVLHNVMEANDAKFAQLQQNRLLSSPSRYVDLVAERQAKTKDAPGSPRVYDFTTMTEETRDTGSSGTVGGNGGLSASHSSIGYGVLFNEFESMAGLRTEDSGLILEFGAGSALLTRLLCENWNAKGFHILWDLPVFSALQAFHLSLSGHKVARVASELSVGTRILCTSNVEQIRLALARLPLENVPGPRLFVATWSLSESPNHVREQVEQVLKRDGTFSHLLITYQHEYQDSSSTVVDNRQYFIDLPGQIGPHHLWETKPIGKNQILVGRPNPLSVPKEDNGEGNVVLATLSVELNGNQELLNIGKTQSVREAVLGFAGKHGLNKEAVRMLLVEGHKEMGKVLLEVETVL